MKFDSNMDAQLQREQLHAAAQNGDIGETKRLLAKKLIDAGADPTIPGWMQLSAKDRASNRKDGDGKKILKLFHEVTNRR